MLDAKLIERFNRYVVPGLPEDCWEWRGSRMPKGYGQLKLTGQRRQIYAHRVAYELVNGPVPPGKQLCHTCDNPSCCNPAHLFVGTSHDNHVDMRRKGRQFGTKLTDLQAREVAALASLVGANQCDLADRYGISQSTVSRISKGQSYALATTGILRQPKE